MTTGYTITITAHHETRLPDALNQTQEPVEVLRMNRPAIDLPAIIAACMIEPKKPRARRSDAGRKRKADDTPLLTPVNRTRA